MEQFRAIFIQSLIGRVVMADYCSAVHAPIMTKATNSSIDTDSTNSETQTRTRIRSRSRRSFLTTAAMVGNWLSCRNGADNCRNTTTDRQEQSEENLNQPILPMVLESSICRRTHQSSMSTSIRNSGSRMSSHLQLKRST